MSRIHYFNPGHETAVLLGTQNYTAPTNVRKMQKDLALLPVWYAEEDDFVYLEDSKATPPFFAHLPKDLHPAPIPVTKAMLAKNAPYLSPMDAAPWGLSPHSLHLFEQLRDKAKVRLSVPTWKEDYFRLTGRQTAAECLEKIHDLMQRSLRIKNTLFLFRTGIAMGRETKTGYKNEKLDRGRIQQTRNDQYRKRIRQSTGFRHGILFRRARYCPLRGIIRFQYRIQEAVRTVLQEVYGSTYAGCIGVDMLVYRQKDGSFAIHPCIEINMRYTMGMVALRLFQHYVAPRAVGDYRVSYEKEAGEALEKHRLMSETYPLRLANGRIQEGYLSLCPVTKDTHYRAYLLLM